MSPRVLRLTLATLVAAAIAACSPPPPPEVAAPVISKRLDAKTELETGRRY